MRRRRDGLRLSGGSYHGYIKCKGQSALSDGQPAYLEVERFVEKPDAKAAEAYFKDGGYYWNSGMFAFTIGTLVKELRKHAPEIAGLYDSGYDRMFASFGQMPDISSQRTRPEM